MKKNFVILFGTLLFLLPTQKDVWVFSINIYQKYISPHKGYRCAYARLHKDSSCSAFGKKVIKENGVLEGLRLLKKRFQDCGESSKQLHMLRWQVQTENNEVDDQQNDRCCGVPPEAQKQNPNEGKDPNKKQLPRDLCDCNCYRGCCDLTPCAESWTCGFGEGGATTDDLRKRLPWDGHFPRLP